MKILRLNPRTKVLPKLPKIQEVREIRVLWCDDGWSYIPQLKIRRKFVIADDNTNEYFHEVWDGIVPASVLYDEAVLYTTYVGSKMWMEVSNQNSELFVIQP